MMIPPAKEFIIILLAAKLMNAFLTIHEFVCLHTGFEMGENG